MNYRMTKRRPSYSKEPKTELKLIKYYSDYQLPWNTLIPRLREYSIQTVDFFRLIGLIWEHFERYRHNIEKFLSYSPLELSCEMVDKQFATLFSKERSELIKRCLRLRQRKLLEAIPSYQREEELSHAD